MNCKTGWTAIVCALMVSTLTGFAGVGADASPSHQMLSAGVVDQPVQDPVLGAVFGGGSARQDAFYSHLGVIHSLSGDLNESGFLIKGFVGGGQYYYDTVAVADGDVDGSILDFAASVGYQQKLAEQWKLYALVGAHLKERFLSEGDPGNGTSGTRVGVQVEGGLSGSLGPVDLEAIGQYTSIENGVWTRGRAGYNTGFYTIKLGPEFIYLRDNDFEEFRAGGFLGFQLTSSLGITTSLGYSEYDSDSASSGSSIYGSAGFVWAY